MFTYLNPKSLRFLVLALIGFSLINSHPLLGWSEYKNIRHMDFDGDQSEEIIIETKQGAGSGHYVEDVRIFKDGGSELSLIFKKRTVDEYFIDDLHYRVVSNVTFSEPDKDTGFRDIVITTEKVSFKDAENKVVSKKEDLGTEVFKWDGKTYLEDKNKGIS